MVGQEKPATFAGRQLPDAGCGTRGRRAAGALGRPQHGHVEPRGRLDKYQPGALSSRARIRALVREYHACPAVRRREARMYGRQNANKAPQAASDV